jgi:hypothetical protein
MNDKEFRESLNRLNTLKEKLDKREDSFLEWVYVRYAEDPNASIDSIVTDFLKAYNYEEQEQTLSIRKSST